MLCRDFVDNSDTVIIDKKRYEQLSMPRCDIEKCEKLETENKEIKTRLYNIWLECQKPFQEDNERVLVDRLAYILHLSSVFKKKELDK